LALLRQRQTAGCVGESPSWLRHRILIPAFQGSNPCSPAIKTKEEQTSRQRKTKKSSFGGFQPFNPIDLGVPWRLKT
jgi:hypothetical protein